MADAFDAARADFSAMGSSPGGPLCLGRVLHKTFLSLDAQGTQAGAATVVEVESGSSAPGRMVYLDRPFLYLLVDCEANLPLFIGALRSLEN
jgi:serpin B